ncbi:MAG: MMPL family transporter [Nocardioides sp.]
MASLLYRLGKTAYRRWPIFIAAWLIALIAVGTVAAAFSKPMTSEFTIPGIDSVETLDLQEELFGDASGESVDDPTFTVVVAAPKGSTLSDEPYAGEIKALIADLSQAPQVDSTTPIVDPVTAAAQQTKAIVGAAVEAGTPRDVAQANAAALSPLSPDGRVGIITATFEGLTVDVEPSSQDAVIDIIEQHRTDGLAVEVNGQGMEATGPESMSSELVGIAVALLVLAITFGSLVAAGLPLLTAIFGVGTGVAGITAMTAVMDIDSSTTLLATMIGLGVGIDYALFILARYRNELDHTEDREEAVGVAVGTAGSAVVFAGLTVIIALAALTVVGIPFLTAMGLGAAVTVVIAVLVALTLLPAILGMLKKKAFGGTFRRYVPKRDERGKIDNIGLRWSKLLGRAPLAFVAVVVVGLGAAAIPMTDLHLAFPTDSTAPADTTQRKAADLVSDAFGPGRQSPMLVVVDGRDIADPADQMASYTSTAEFAASLDNVANAQLARVNPEGTGALIIVTPEYDAADSRTEDLLDDLRAGEPDIEAQTGATVGVTGIVAIQTDVSVKLAQALPVYLGIVIGLAFLLLILVFRSILVPLTATLGFLLSVTATIGATVLLFQEGTFGLFPGQPIISFMPIFLIGLVFGLAMDYQVFLVTRVREAYVHGDTYWQAVHDGFRNSARVVTAAALIMTSVFAGFILIDEPIIQSMGFALAVAILFDAFAVRMCLIPALLYLMGDKAWWLPKWLDRILPTIDIEGTALERPHMVKADEDPELQPVK